jgi:hypothetical protein
MRLLASAVLVLLAGCASFRGEELPRRGFREAVGDEPLPAVSYRISNPPGGPGLPLVLPEATVERVLRRAFVEAERKENDGGLHLDVRCTSRQRAPVFTVGLGLVSIFTLGIIPAYGRSDLRLEVEVEFEGKVAKRYEYEDHVNTWIQLFLIPWAFSHDPVEVGDAELENMLLNFLYDFRRDLPRLAAAPGAGPG